MSTFKLDIVTPERMAYNDEIEEISVPTPDGIISVLPHHVPIFTRLTEGELKIIKKQEEIYFAIGGGFMEVTPEKIEILVTSAYHADELNEKEVMDAKKRAEDALNAKPEGEALIEAQQLFHRSIAGLKVLGRKKRLGQNLQ